MRSEGYLLVALSLATIVLVFIRRSWAARILQVVLLLAAAEWVFTAINLIEARRALGADYVRAAGILLAVALVNVIAAALYRTPRLARRYRLVREPESSADAKTSAQGA